MISLQNDSGKVVQLKEGFSWVFFLFGPWVWLAKGHPAKFMKSLLKCCLFIPWITGFMGSYNKELLSYYLERGYKKI
jgi:hypothetical protein